MSILTLVITLVLVEAVLRILFPGEAFRAGRELTHFRRRDVAPGSFDVDPDMGFRPVLGTGSYNTWGTLTNNYPLEKRPGVCRVLFVGDSVTARGYLIEALRRLYGEDRYEYWNAGVESFNTVQEVKFFQRYNRNIHPDLVILTFHLNDFETTPVAFRTRNGHLRVYAPNMPAAQVHPWWFAHSLTYRLLLGMIRFSERNLDAVISETETALVTLWHDTMQSGIPLRVIVFPILKPIEQWDRADRLSYAQILDILRRYHIPHIDLLPALERAIPTGVPLTETPGDVWHPSPEAATLFAQYLFEVDLLRFP